jgi:hypothetical protein
MSSATSLIQYIGLKAKKTDTTCGTGLTWMQGQTQEVGNEFLPALLKHVDVWRLASEPVAPKAMTLAQAHADGLVLEPESPAPVVEPVASVQAPQAEPEKQAEPERADPGAVLVEPVDAEELEDKLNAMDDKAVRAFAAEKGLTVAANSRGSALRSKVLSLLSEG